MLEWDDVTRHWWRYDKDGVAMVHRASGEAIVYRGRLPDEGWHRFDYLHDGTAYPLAVQIKRVRYPNPQPNRWDIPPWNGGGTPFLTPWTWRIDHRRSLDLWQNGRESIVPYWLWSRADIGMVDCALVWPRGTPVGEPAQEASVNGGWMNGRWTNDVYRRFYWYEPLEMTQYRPWKNIHCLPLSDYALTPVDARSLEWETVEGPAFDGYGSVVPQQARIMRDTTGEFRIGKHAGAQTYFDPKSPARAALTALWKGLYVTSGISVSDGLTIHSKYDNQLTPNVMWHSGLSIFGTFGWVDGQRNPELERWLGKPVVPSDFFFQRPTSWQYNEAVIDKIVASYRLWRTFFDAYASALPNCSGFEGSTSAIQGDVGTVLLRSGFVAGTMGMISEIRLRLRVETDPPDFDWRRFF